MAAAPDRDAVVSPQVAGRLVRVVVREGDAVTRNAIVAEVESQPLRDALRQAQALRAQARAARDAAAAAANREEHLFERGISARQTFEAARSALGQTSATVALADAQVDLAQRNVERALVRAPIGGVVVRLLRHVGEVVDGTPATPVLEIADPSTLELAATAVPGDVIALARGQEATLSFEALPGRTFAASVRSVSPSVDPVTGLGAIRLSVEAQEGARPPLGLLGSALVAVGPPRQVLAVPASAIRSAGGARTEVVVCEGGRAHPRDVVVGARLEKSAEIAKGLGAQERVVVEGVAGLEDGVTIAEEK